MPIFISKSIDYKNFTFQIDASPVKNTQDYEERISKIHGVYKYLSNLKLTSQQKSHFLLLSLQKITKYTVPINNDNNPQSIVTPTVADIKLSLDLVRMRHPTTHNPNQELVISNHFSMPLSTIENELAKKRTILLKLSQPQFSIQYNEENTNEIKEVYKGYKYNLLASSFVLDLMIDSIAVKIPTDMKTLSANFERCSLTYKPFKQGYDNKEMMQALVHGICFEKLKATSSIEYTPTHYKLFQLLKMYSQLQNLVKTIQEEQNPNLFIMHSITYVNNTEQITAYTPSITLHIAELKEISVHSDSETVGIESVHAPKKYAIHNFNKKPNKTNKPNENVDLNTCYQFNVFKYLTKPAIEKINQAIQESKNTLDLRDPEKLFFLRLDIQLNMQIMYIMLNNIYKQLSTTHKFKHIEDTTDEDLMDLMDLMDLNLQEIINISYDGMQSRMQI